MNSTDITVVSSLLVVLMSGTLLYVVGRGIKYAYSKAKNKKG